VSFIFSTAGDAQFEATGLGEVIAIGTDGKDRSGSLNRAASQSSGDILVFLDGDLSLARRETIDELVGAAIQPNVGAVGCRIVGTDGIVEQGGIVLQTDLSPAFAHGGFPREAAGNLFRNRQIGNFSAISASCMAIRRALFEEIGGFNSDTFLETLFDIDLCLKLRENGKRIVVLPHIEFIRHGSAQNAPQFYVDELAKFRNRWAKYKERDPFCNPNLKRDGSFEIDLFV
jgi:GT2 family glycosyltransferase